MLQSYDLITTIVSCPLSVVASSREPILPGRAQTLDVYLTRSREGAKGILLKGSVG
jgi:hypothetical protein